MSKSRDLAKIAGTTTFGFKSMQVFATPGTFTWTKPAGITRIKVIVTGGGGGGVQWSSYSGFMGPGGVGGGGHGSVSAWGPSQGVRGDTGGYAQDGYAFGAGGGGQGGDYGQSGAGFQGVVLIRYYG